MEQPTNPYGSPQTQFSLALHTRSPKAVAYRSGWFLATVTILFLLACGVLQGVSTVWEVRDFQTMTSSQLRQDRNLPPIVQIDRIFYGTENWKRLTRYAQSVVEGVATLYFLCWLFQVHNNLVPLGVRGLMCGPRWAVGMWFVPLVNLVLPYRVASELWRGSDPAITEDERGQQWKQLPTSLGVLQWWLLMIGRQVLGMAWLIMAVQARTESAEIFAFWLGTLYAAVSLGSWLAWVWFVQDVTRRQQQKYARQTGQTPQRPVRAKPPAAAPLDWTGLDGL